MSRPVGIRNSFPVGNDLTRWLARKGWSPWYILRCQSLDRELAISVVPDLDWLAQFTRAFRRSFLVPSYHSLRIGNRCGAFSISVTMSEWRSSFAESDVRIAGGVRYAPHNPVSLLSWQLVVFVVLTLMLVFF